MWREYEALLQPFSHRGRIVPFHISTENHLLSQRQPPFIVVVGFKHTQPPYNLLPTMATRTPGRTRTTEHKQSNPFANLDLHEILKMDQPAIDLRMEHIEKKMATFKLAMARYTASNAEEVTKRRTAHVRDVEKLRVETTQVEQDIHVHRTREISLAKST